MMDKSKFNIVINGCMFLSVMAITGIGILMKFVLLPGKETAAVYGRKVDLFFLKMDRHGWGTIHLIIACVFLAFLTTHIILNWKMLVTSYRRLIGNKTTRLIVTMIVLISGIFTVSFPWFVKPEVRESTKRR
ncbi:MAG: DUF4405 domain-containing protein [Candidatus Brocadiaceae bacterium]